jgi:hypothetical protein
MPNALSALVQHHRISVLYGDGSHSFWLAQGATLGELAGHIGGLDALHDAGPLTIDIAFKQTPALPILPLPIAHLHN